MCSLTIVTQKWRLSLFEWLRKLMSHEVMTHETSTDEFRGAVFRNEKPTETWNHDVSDKTPPVCLKTRILPLGSDAEYTSWPLPWMNRPPLMATKGTKTKGDPDRIVCRNRKATHEYEILDELDCGIMLAGSEVKSVRNNKITIDEGFARVERGEVWLYNVDIAEYSQANLMNHPLRRPRKLLLKKREIEKFAARADESGMSLIPLDVHFSRGFVKIKLGVGKGRKLHDKREKLKNDDARREIQQAMRKR